MDLRRLALLSLILLSPSLATCQEPDENKKEEKSVMFIVAGMRSSKQDWIKLDRTLRKVDGVRRVDVVPDDDDDFCQARVVYEGTGPSLKRLIEEARKAGFDAMDLPDAKKRFAGDPSKRILLDIPYDVRDKEDAINLEIPLRQIEGVKKVQVIFGEDFLELGQAIVVVTYDANRPDVTALLTAVKKAGFEASERKTGLPATGGKKKPG